MGFFNKQKKDEEKKSESKKAVEPKKDDVKVVSTKEEKNSSMKDLYSGSAKEGSAVDNKEKTKGSKDSTPKMAYRVLLKPLITEKATDLGTDNKYLFEVSVNTNKVEISKAIEEVYGVRPISVNVINNKGKKVRRGRVTGKKKDWKKAMVKLPKGKSINIYEGV